jgi:cyclophilin family peptidyl-prolyl cis-trans isomerase
MTLARSLAIAATFALAAPLAAQTPPETPALAPSEIVAAAPASDWVAIEPADLLVMDLAPDARGRARRVIIQLMPPPFSQGWIGNIRTLAAAHWWDGTSINRVQDNYVVQWGDATEAKALPEGLRVVPEVEYIWQRRLLESIGPHGGVDYAVEPEIAALKDRDGNQLADAYGGFRTGFYAGWQWAMANYGDPSAWTVHCYGMVGVGRNLSPDTGTGAELYTVIGHAPRHLDRNIALVGRVIEGIEHLSSLPRGTEALGFYASAEERVPIISVRIATELPAAEQPRFQYLSTESATFARYADARANRGDPFFNVPAGGADICNIPVPVRRVPTP